MGRRDGGRSDFFCGWGSSISSFDGTDFTSESAKTSGVGNPPPVALPVLVTMNRHD